MVAKGRIRPPMHIVTLKGPRLYLWVSYSVESWTPVHHHHSVIGINDVMTEREHELLVSARSSPATVQNRDFLMQLLRRGLLWVKLPRDGIEVEHHLLFLKHLVLPNLCKTTFLRRPLLLCIL